MTEQPLRVCLVSPVPPPYGGISHWTAMILRHTRERRDVQFRVINTAPRWRRVEDLQVWKRLFVGSMQLLRDMVLFAAKLTVWRPHVVHLTTSGQFAILRDLAVMILAAIVRTPVVYHIRFGRVPQIAESNTREWRLMALAMRLARCVIAIDSGTTNTIESHFPTVCCLQLPNCVASTELPAPSTKPACPPVVLFVGWVLPSKGVKELVAAWARLAPEGWRLNIAGPGDPAYQNDLLAEHRAAQVAFLGELEHSEAMAALASASVFALPSHTEGFPNVVLEAMCLGKAIVATRVGAIPDMLSDGCGVLVEPKNVESLIGALREVIGDATLRESLGQRARAKALAEYELSSVFKRLLDIWRNAANGTTTRRTTSTLHHEPANATTARSRRVRHGD